MIAHWYEQLAACEHLPNVWFAFYFAGLEMGLKPADLAAYYDTHRPVLAADGAGA